MAWFKCKTLAPPVGKTSYTLTTNGNTGYLMVNKFIGDILVDTFKYSDTSGSIGKINITRNDYAGTWVLTCNANYVSLNNTRYSSGETIQSFSKFSSGTFGPYVEIPVISYKVRITNDFGQIIKYEDDQAIEVIAKERSEFLNNYTSISLGRIRLESNLYAAQFRVFCNENYIIYNGSKYSKDNKVADWAISYVDVEQGPFIESDT